MLEEVLRCLRPAPRELAVDCTLGGGGHALAILERLQPGGRLLALDIDPIELPRTEQRLRAAGSRGPSTPSRCHARTGGGGPRASDPPRFSRAGTASRPCRGCSPKKESPPPI